MRIHGKKVIRRSDDVAPKKDYRAYKPDLQRDFMGICGYCGKHEMLSHKGMEPDHFVPKNIDKNRECDYTNLVYSCFTCNHKKLGKWPTGDKSRPNDGNSGFVDPATAEFDNHLGRSEDGTIEYYTSIGKYMYDVAFKFGIRPTKEIWLASQLYEHLCELQSRDINHLTAGEQRRFLEITAAYNELNTYLFSSGE